MSTPNSTTYIAAVVEYPPRYVKNNSELTLKANSDAYVDHIKTASMQVNISEKKLVVFILFLNYIVSRKCS